MLFLEDVIAREAQSTPTRRSLTLLASPASCGKRSSVGATTSARVFIERCCAEGSVLLRCAPFSSDCLPSWIIGSRYASDYPDPASDASRYSWYFSRLLRSVRTRCLSESAWIGVERASTREPGALRFGGPP